LTKKGGINKTPAERRRSGNILQKGPSVMQRASKHAKNTEPSSKKKKKTRKKSGENDVFEEPKKKQGGTQTRGSEPKKKPKKGKQTSRNK